MGYCPHSRPNLDIERLYKTLEKTNSEYITYDYERESYQWGAKTN